MTSLIFSGLALPGNALAVGGEDIIDCYKQPPPDEEIPDFRDRYPNYGWNNTENAPDNKPPTGMLE